MNVYLKTSILIILLVTTLFSQSDEPRVEIYHPSQDMPFWVDQIEVAGNIPDGSQVAVNGEKVSPDQEGLFRHMVTLTEPEVFIHIAETRGNQEYLDTIRVFHRNLDQMTPDSVFINNNIPAELAIHFGSPRSGKYYGSEVSLRGRTHPDATLFMNGDTVDVYASGSFASHVQIQPGENVFAFVATWNGVEVRDTIQLSRPLPPPTPEALVEKSAKPRRERWILADEHLQLGIQGPELKKVYFKIPGLTGWQLMDETRPGIYSATARLIGVDHEMNTKVLYRIGSFSKRVSSAPLRILTDALGGLSIEEDTRVYDTPTTDQLLFPMTDSVSFQIVGLENRMYKIRLGQYRTGYVRAANIKLDPTSKLTAPHYLGSMRSEIVEDWTIFRMYTGSTRLPFEIKEKAIPARLELKVYGAKQGWEWTTYPEDNSTIAYLERSQPEDFVWQMDFYPQHRFWGWYGRYEGDYLVIGVRKAPEISKSAPFANISIEIDPGHGGWQRGAVGPAGYCEADANLRYSLKLEKLLRDAGAEVFITRTVDRQLSLSDRATKAREDSVHIFIWAHNNAPGSRRDIKEASGSSTFFTWPSSKALSDKIYPHLGTMGIATSGKVARYYYYMTRQTEYLVYLIEGAFMTNPEEEMFLLSEEGLDALAQSAFKGLETFLLEQANSE